MDFSKIKSRIKMSHGKLAGSRPDSPGITSLPGSGSVTNTPITPKSSNQRSRKEKLVVRSFSAQSLGSEMEIMEPHILTREEFLKEKKQRKINNPSTPTKTPVGSRESSPVNESNINSPPNNGETTETPTVVEKCDSVSKRNQEKKYKSHSKSMLKSNNSRKITKNKNTDVVIRIKRGPHSTFRKMTKSVNLTVETKKPSQGSVQNISPISSSNKSVVVAPNPAVTFVKNASFSPRSPNKSGASRSPFLNSLVYSPEPCIMKQNHVPSPSPTATAAINCQLISRRQFLSKSDSKLVKYGLSQDRLGTNVLRSFHVTTAGASTSTSFLFPPLIQPIQIQAPKKGPRQKFDMTKTPRFADTTNSNENETNGIQIHCLSNQEHEELQNRVRLDPLVLSQGVEKLQDLVKNISLNQVEIEGVTVPQICAEAVAKLGKIASEFHFNSPAESDADDRVEDEENFKSPFVRYAHNLIRNNGATKELKVLMESNQDATRDEQQSSSNPIFPVGISFMRQTPLATLPRIRVEELQILQELLTPDEHFELREDELETVKLYIELMRSELKTFKEDQQKTKRMSSILNNPEDVSRNTGRKIVDAYAIPVKFISEKERARVKAALPGVILSHEEVAKTILKNQPNSVTEFKTRRLRSGNKVPLEKISLENAKLNSNVDKTDRTNPKPCASSSTVPPTQIDTKADCLVTLEPVMTLRDGKELPYDEKGCDIFRTGQVFKVEVKPEILEKELKPWSLDGGVNDEYYSQKVEANLKRLRNGGKEYEFEYERLSKMMNAGERVNDDASNLHSKSLPTTIKKEESPSTAWNYPNSANSGNPSVASGSQSSDAILSRPFYPAISFATPPDQLRKKLFTLPVDSNSSSSCSPDTPPSYRGGNISNSQQKQLRARYSRQQHSLLCPPFENNHCSFTAHFCPYSRAPGSRFCILHVDEGATLQFERCKYFKDSRECGRFIPKADLNSLQIFCGLHATIVANARRKKLKQEKENDKPKDNILITQLNNNLDRAKGAIMELNEEGHFTVRKELIQDEDETLNNSSGSDSEEGGDVTTKTKLFERVGDDDTDVDDFELEETADGNEHVFNYDCLRNAGYYTVDEAVKISHQKLLKKRQLILRLMKIEKLKFKHKWKKYFRSTQLMRKQKVNNYTTDPKLISTSCLTSRYSNMPHKEIEQFIQNEVKVNNETRAMLNHRHSRGPSNILRRRVLNKRQVIFNQDEAKRRKFECKEEVKINSRRKPPNVICNFGSCGSAGFPKCNQPSLPLSRFCKTHITEDRNQKFYKSCLFKYGTDLDDVCSTPVFTELEKFGCSIHAQPILPKNPPPTLKENRKPKVEDEVEKIIEEEDVKEIGAEGSTESVGGDDKGEEELRHDLEYMVGDEVVNVDHFRETIRSIYGKGLCVTDSEESDDTDEEEEEPTSESL